MTQDFTDFAVLNSEHAELDAKIGGKLCFTPIRDGKPDEKQCAVGLRNKWIGTQLGTLAAEVVSRSLAQNEPDCGPFMEGADHVRIHLEAELSVDFPIKIIAGTPPEGWHERLREVGANVADRSEKHAASVMHMVDTQAKLMVAVASRLQETLPDTITDEARLNIANLKDAGEKWLNGKRGGAS